jgi:hypothetical protein
MESLDYWRLCDELSVIQAALLIVGEDPAPIQDYVADWSAQDRPKGYDASFAALKHAILAGRLKVAIRKNASERGWARVLDPGESIVETENNGYLIFENEPNWHATTIQVENLKIWLRSRGFKSGFFFPVEQAGADYLNPNDPSYAPKLAAAIGAWESLKKDPVAMRGKTAKQAMQIWLRLNAATYGLSKDDGTPNEQGIEEIAKIANWDMKGGAPKTPGQ